MKIVNLVTENCFLVYKNQEGKVKTQEVDLSQLTYNWKAGKFDCPADDDQVIFAFVDGKAIHFSSPWPFYAFMDIFGVPDAEDEPEEVQEESRLKPSRRKVAVKRIQKKERILKNASGSTVLKDGHIKSRKDFSGRMMKARTNHQIRQQFREEVPQKGNYHRRAKTGF